MKRILTLLSFILILTGRAETPWVALGGVTSPANNSVFINPPSAGVSLPYTVPGGETLTITGYGVETLWGAGIFIFTQSMDTINAGGGVGRYRPASVWDSSGARAGEMESVSSSLSPTSILESRLSLVDRMLIATIDLSRKYSPHWNGGPLMSAPAGRTARWNTFKSNLTQASSQSTVNPIGKDG